MACGRNLAPQQPATFTRSLFDRNDCENINTNMEFCTALIMKTHPTYEEKFSRQNARVASSEREHVRSGKLNLDCSSVRKADELGIHGTARTSKQEKTYKWETAGSAEASLEKSKCFTNLPVKTRILRWTHWIPTMFCRSKW